MLRPLRTLLDVDNPHTGPVHDVYVDGVHYPVLGQPWRPLPRQSAAAVDRRDNYLRLWPGPTGSLLGRDAMAGGRVVGSSRSDRTVRLLARGLHPNQLAVLDSRWHPQMDSCWSRSRQLRILSVSDLGDIRADEMTELYSVRNIYPILASVSRPSKFNFPSSHPSSPGRQ